MFNDEGYKLMGTAFEIYNQLGYGMAEQVYQQSLEIELALRKMPYVSKSELEVFYKAKKRDTHFKPDLLVYGALVVELKAVSNILAEHEAQLFNYLRLSRHVVGCLINFGHKGDLEWKRFILDDLHQTSVP